MTITENIKTIKKTIPPDVTLVAATKTRTVDEIKEAIKAGIGIIGENYVQEAEKKQVLRNKVKFHCIGHLQTNKVRAAVELFDMIEIVDSLRIAKEINKKCENVNKIIPVLIEVNIAKEPSKFGCMPRDVEKLIGELRYFPNLEIKGLMAMAPFFDDPEKNRPFFKKMKEIFDSLKEKYNLTMLSMGMSDSYKVAVEEGATLVRIGAGIFGKRNV